MIRLFKNNFELLFWVAALIVLASTDPQQQNHFSLCPLKTLGISWCPGCGIGHAISFLLRGDFENSFKAHWLGIPALAVTIHRIVSLSVIQITNFKSLKTC